MPSVPQEVSDEAPQSGLQEPNGSSDSNNSSSSPTSPQGRPLSRKPTFGHSAYAAQSLTRSARLSPRKRRLIGKYGQTRIYGTVPSLQSWRANFRDLFNYLLSVHTWFLILIFMALYISSFSIFGAIWYGIYKNTNSCLVEVHDFATAFLFSVETQTTIGYGSKHVSGVCSGGIVILLIQIICGKLIDAVLVGLIFARLSRPDNRLYTLRCSKKAVICPRDGEQCLLIRVGDMRQRQAPLVQCEAKLLLITDKVTKEGEHLPYNVQRLEVDSDSNSGTPMLAIPVELVHVINRESPLFGLTQDHLEKSKAEIVLVLNGQIANLGLTVELRSSFLPSEIKVNHRFRQICHREADGSCWTNWNLFDETEPLDAITAREELLERNHRSPNLEGVSSASSTMVRLQPVSSNAIENTRRRGSSYSLAYLKHRDGDEREKVPIAELFEEASSSVIRKTHVLELGPITDDKEDLDHTTAEEKQLTESASLCAKGKGRAKPPESPAASQRIVRINSKTEMSEFDSQSPITETSKQRTLDIMSTTLAEQKVVVDAETGTTLL